MNTTEHLCMINRTLESLIVDFERYKISIFDYKRVVFLAWALQSWTLR